MMKRLLLIGGLLATFSSFSQVQSHKSTYGDWFFDEARFGITAGYRGFNNSLVELGAGLMIVEFESTSDYLVAAGIGMNLKGLWIPSVDIYGAEAESWIGLNIMGVGADVSWNNTVYFQDGRALVATRPEIGYTIAFAHLNYGFHIPFGSNWDGIPRHNLVLRVNLPLQPE